MRERVRKPERRGKREINRGRKWKRGSKRETEEER